MSSIPPFPETIKHHGLGLSRRPVEILQVNVGRLCNQACHHCHVEAGPKRTEIMNQETVERVLELLAKSPTIRTVDITGGAPELNSNFRHLVRSASALGLKVIDRCNLTVFFELKQEDTPQFLRDNRVEIIASLPCYSKENVDKQRGNGVFDKSIRALQLLNDLGYGKPDTGLTLNLVYNPLGPFLPPGQLELEKDYKVELYELFGIEFNHLFTITNMPIKRFLRDLERNGKLEEYMNLLVQSFNPIAAKDVMCRNLISIGWDGQIYDCDFNQMLELPVTGSKRTIWNIESFDDFQHDPIVFGSHCYGCTAGAGSSCGGSLT